MSLSNTYESLISQLHEKIALLASKMGVCPIMRGDAKKFLDVSSLELSVGDTPIKYLNEEIALGDDGYEFSVRCFEVNGMLQPLIEGIERLDEEADSEAHPCEDDEEGPFIFIRGYRDEEDLDAQRSESIDKVTEQEWDDGKGEKIIEDNEPFFHHIEAANEDGALVY